MALRVWKKDGNSVVVVLGGLSLEERILLDKMFKGKEKLSILSTESNVTRISIPEGVLEVGDVTAELHDHFGIKRYYIPKPSSSAQPSMRA